jgi:hypothetical protein
MIKQIYTFLLIIFLTYSITGQSNQWQVLGDMPHPVSGGQAIALDSFIVVLGGNNDSLGMPVNDIQIYHPLSQSWVFASQLVENRYGFVADVFSDSIIISCGGIWFPTINLFSIEMWDFINPAFNVSQIYNHDLNFGRVNFTGHVYNNDLYIIGGLPSPASTDSLMLPYIAEYNIPSASITHTFNALYSPFLLPYHEMSAIVGEEIFIFGGAHFSVINEIHKFNVNTKNYQFIGNLLSNRAAGDAVAYDQLIYIIGGYNESRNALNTVEIFDTNADSIWSGPELNFERSEMMAVKFQNSIYVFGGTNNFFTPVQTVEKLDLLNKVDILEPSILKEFRLHNNYPNPFNSKTNIIFDLDLKSDISLDVYTISGKHLKNIVRKTLSMGKHIYVWDGTDENNQNAASGVYIYQLKNHDITLSKKMILLR